MKSAAKAGVRSRWWRPAVCILACGLAPQARADRWLIENTFETRLESNDNVTLSPTPTGIVNTLSLSSNLNASRQMENSATRATLFATALRQQGNGGQDRIDGRLGLNQSFRDPLNSFDIDLSYAQDFNNGIGTADVAVGRGRRRTTTLASSWSRSLSERLSTSAQLSLTRTGYARRDATDFSNSALSTNLSYRLSEVDTVSLQASRSAYRTRGDTSRSTTDDAGAGWTRVLSDRSSATLNVGAYRTETSAPRRSIACPLEASLCNAGLVPFVIVEDRPVRSARGLQFSAAYQFQFDERTSLSISAARQQTPSGAGAVVRNDTLTATAAQALTPTLTGSVNYAQSRSAYQGSAVRALPGQQRLTLSLSKQLAPDLTLESSYQLSRAGGYGTTGSARANSIGISLVYAWPRVDATR